MQGLRAVSVLEIDSNTQRATFLDAYMLELVG